MFVQNWHENEKKLDRGRASLAPLRSATGKNLEHTVVKWKTYAKLTLQITLILCSTAKGYRSFCFCRVVVLTCALSFVCDLMFGKRNIVRSNKKTPLGVFTNTQHLLAVMPILASETLLCEKKNPVKNATSSGNRTWASHNL